MLTKLAGTPLWFVAVDGPGNDRVNEIFATTGTTILLSFFRPIDNFPLRGNFRLWLFQQWWNAEHQRQRNLNHYLNRLRRL